MWFKQKKIGLRGNLKGQMSTRVDQYLLETKILIHPDIFLKIAQLYIARLILLYLQVVI